MIFSSDNKFIENGFIVEIFNQNISTCTKTDQANFDKSIFFLNFGQIF